MTRDTAQVIHFSQTGTVFLRWSGRLGLNCLLCGPVLLDPD